MKYEFPVIETFEDIEHAIDPKMFMVAQRDGHVIVNYLFASPDVFPDIDPNCDIAKIRREFRGLIFDEAGNLIRRPFHKFFNVGERQDTQLQNIDVQQEHIIFDKLDGSMIAPYQVGIDLIWGTKMGNTDVGQQARDWVQGRDNYFDFVNEMLANGKTPIFEWVSRKQRIVLDYGVDNLVLTAVRDMKTGEYISHKRMENMGSEFELPVCGTVRGESFTEDFHEKTKDAQDIEGFVIRFDDGHMAKIKCEWYCDLHRVKSEIAFERGVVRLLINDAMDDLKPLMPIDDLKEIEEYEAAFTEALRSAVEHIRTVAHCICLAGTSRKDYALTTMQHNPGYVNQIIFRNWDTLLGLHSPEIAEQLKEIILGHCNKNAKFDALRKTKLFEDVKPWRGIDINE